MSAVQSLALPNLSVILPNYNHGRYLREALGAILNQSVRPLEVVVYDDGSTDDSVRIIREIAAKDPIVRLVADTHRAGANANFNRGLREIKGDFVYGAAADDCVLPGFFEKSMTLLAQNPDAKLCVADLAQFNAVTGRVRYLRPRLSSHPAYVSRDQMVNRLARQRVHMYGCMTVFHSATLRELGGVSPALKWYADWFCVLVLALRHGTCYIPETLTTMRMLPGSYSAAGAKNPVMQDELFRLLFDLLRSGQYADVGESFFKTGTLCLLGSQILRVLTTDSRYRDILSLRLLMRLLGNIPVTVLGLNPATESPLGFLDRAVRGTLGLDSYIQKYGVQLDSPGSH